MLCMIQNSQNIVHSAQTWCLGLQLWSFFSSHHLVYEVFLSNGPTAVVTFHDVHFIYITAEQSIAHLLSLFKFPRGYMQMIPLGEFLPTFRKLVFIVMELFLRLPNDLLHVAASSIWAKPLSFTTCSAPNCARTRIAPGWWTKWSI